MKKAPAKKTTAPTTKSPIKKSTDKKATARKAQGLPAGVKKELAERQKLREEVDRLVPEAGKGRRWYDLPYNLLWWLSRDWRRRIFTRRTLERFNYASNYLLTYNEHRRHLASPGAHDFGDYDVPGDEHVTLPSIFIIELFPPSETHSLEAAIDRHNWDRRRRQYGLGESNRERLQRSRAGMGWTWWPLAEIATPDAGYLLPDGTRERLPEEFEFIELKAFQIGPALTAVAAHFRLTATAAKRLDGTWHAEHSPLLLRGEARPRPLDRMGAAWHHTQGTRAELHEAARRWLSAKCPGFFAAHGESQPLLDVLLTERTDPLKEGFTDRHLEHELRALGLTEHVIYERTSPQLPKLLLVPTDAQMSPRIDPRTLTLWGQDAAVRGAVSHLSAYGGDSIHAIGHRYDDPIQGFLLTYSIGEFLCVAEAEYSTLRDQARQSHRRFKAHAIKTLRQTLLTLSIDVTSLRRDLERYWTSDRWPIEEAQFSLDYAERIRIADRKAGRKPLVPIDVNQQMKDDQREHINRLTEIDRDYRDVVSTAATLGASVDTFRTGRLALVIAFASLAVAVATLLTTTQFSP